MKGVVTTRAALAALAVLAAPRDGAGPVRVETAYDAAARKRLHELSMKLVGLA